jgi:hypothetical protein
MIGKENLVHIEQVDPRNTSDFILPGFIAGNSVVLTFFLFFLLLVFKLDDVFTISWDLVFLIPLSPLILPTLIVVARRKAG